MSSASTAWKAGDKCLAMYEEDGLWYHATVVKPSGAGFLVLYDDYGDEEELPPELLRSLDVLALAGTDATSADTPAADTQQANSATSSQQQADADEEEEEEEEEEEKEEEEKKQDVEQDTTDAPLLLNAPLTIGSNTALKKKKKKKKKSSSALTWLQDTSTIKKEGKRAQQARKRKEIRLRQEAARKSRAERRKKLAFEQYLASRGVQNHTRDVNIFGYSMSTPDGKEELLGHADIKLAHGRRYGLIGRNGVGKSTLLEQISNYEIPKFPTHLRVMHVEQEVVGTDVTVLDWVMSSDQELQHWKRKEAEYKAALEEQDSKKVDTDKGNDDDIVTKLNQVYENLKACEAWSAEARASTILSGLQFTPEMQRAPTKSLSGGWRMRVALACTLFVQPDILLLDEPTNHLDLPAVVWLEQHLQSYKNTLILVSHDRSFVNNVITDVVYFYDGTLTYYRGNYDDFERIREEHMKSAKREYNAQQMRLREMQSFIDKFRYNAKRASLVQSRLKAIKRMDILEDVQEDPLFRFSFPDPGLIKGPIVQCQNVAFGYDATKPPLLKNVNLRVDMESRIGVVGANGVGKSTLIKVMMGILEETQGFVTRNGHARIALFAQHHMDQLQLDLSPLEYMQEKMPKAKLEDLRSHLARFGIPERLSVRQIASLSGGQKSRVAFSVVTWNKPHVIIMDEPTNHLDLETIEALIIAVQTYSGGVLLISHDQHFLSSVCTEYWGVANRKVSTFHTFAQAKDFCYKRVLAAAKKTALAAAK